MLSNPIESALTRDDIATHGNTCLETAARLRAELLTLARGNEPLSWSNTFAKLDQMNEALMLVNGIAGLMSVVHPNADVRSAAEAWDPRITTFLTEFFLDADLAALFQRASEYVTSASTAHAIFIQDTLRDFRRNGLELPPEGQARLRNMNEELTKLGQAFERNLATITSHIDVDPQDLEGLPEAYIANHPADESGKVTITTNTPDRITFMKYTRNRAAARELYTVSMNRAKDENLPLLDKILALRFEKAKLLGYPTWADFVLEPRMAKNVLTVERFLEDVRHSIHDGVAKELSILKEFAPLPISIADVSYVEEIACKTKYALDSQKLSEYFEFNSTLQGLMRVASLLFNVQFLSVIAPVWHPDVQPVDVVSHAGEPIGRLYLDLFPRADKYKHAAMFPIRSTSRLADGSRVIPIAALVCNFTKPSDHPSLLTHGEVITLFHEFGHALHEILSRAELVSQAGTRVAWDFVETPSQLFEEFAWSREALAIFAKHHKTGEPLPQNLYDAMIRARQFGEAIGTAQQLYYASLDQAYHTREPGFDTTQLMEQFFREYLPFEPVPNTHFQATFGHLVNYDAGYYSYQWALAIARDLLTRFENEGMFNPKVASDYRTMILEQGSSQDESGMIERFLGRPTNLEAYKKFLRVK